MGFHPTPLLLFEIKLPRYKSMTTQDELKSLAILATKEKIHLNDGNNYATNCRVSRRTGRSYTRN